MSELLFMKPYLKDVLWGGTRLRDEYGYAGAGDHTGEAWCISATPPGCSTVKSGTYKDKTLQELWDTHRELFGNISGETFPLLVKIIDAAEDLSIQVHPDDAQAAALEQRPLGKTECWYVIDAADDADIVIGHNAATKTALRDFIQKEQWQQLLRVLPLCKGDFFFIPPGTVHAIRKGTLILEIQQNSDITYRLYDYDRLQDGKKRPLHIDKSLEVITCPQQDVPSSPAKTAVFQKCGKGYLHRHLVSCSYFEADLWQKEESCADASLTLEQPHPFLLVDIIRGSGHVEGIAIQAGDHFLVPSGYGTLTFTGNTTFVTSHIA